MKRGPTGGRGSLFLRERGRDARFVEHEVRELVAQRLDALALGYEDLNDHTDLRRDPLLAVAANKLDPLGTARRCEAHGVQYVLGLARNARLLALLGPALMRARERAVPVSVRCVPSVAKRQRCFYERETENPLDFP